MIVWYREHKEVYFCNLTELETALPTSAISKFDHLINCRKEVDVSMFFLLFCAVCLWLCTVFNNSSVSIPHCYQYSTSSSSFYNAWMLLFISTFLAEFQTIAKRKKRLLSRSLGHYSCHLHQFQPTVVTQPPHHLLHSGRIMHAHKKLLHTLSSVSQIFVMICDNQIVCVTCCDAMLDIQ